MKIASWRKMIVLGIIVIISRHALKAFREKIIILVRVSSNLILFVASSKIIRIYLMLNTIVTKIFQKMSFLLTNSPSIVIQSTQS